MLFNNETVRAAGGFEYFAAASVSDPESDPLAVGFAANSPDQEVGCQGSPPDVPPVDSQQVSRTHTPAATHTQRRFSTDPEAGTGQSSELRAEGLGLRAEGVRFQRKTLFNFVTI